MLLKTVCASHVMKTTCVNLHELYSYSIGHNPNRDKEGSVPVDQPLSDQIKQLLINGKFI